MSDWSAELTLRFLGAYFSEPGIWDPRDPRHKDRGEVAAAWGRVEAALESRASVVELKRKRENLMSTYRKLHNKVRASRAAGGEEFRPDWFAYDLMAAHLDNVYCPRVQAFKTEELEDTTSEYDIRDFEESTPSEEELKELEVPVNPEVLLQSSSGGQRLQRSKKRRINALLNHPYQQLIHHQQQQAEERKTADDQSSEECSLFLELLDIKLRSLGGGLREVAMNQIDNLLHHLRMQQNLSTQMAGVLPTFQQQQQYVGSGKYFSQTSPGPHKSSAQQQSGSGQKQ